MIFVMNKIFCFIALLSLYVLGQMLIIPPIFAEDRKRPTAGEFSLMPKIGTDFTIGGDFVKSASESATLTFRPGEIITADISADSQDFDDVYENPFKIGVNLNLGLTDNTEAFLGLKYMRANAENFDALTIDVAGTFLGAAINASEVLTGKFDDYREFGFGVGARHFLNRYDAFTPYVSLEGEFTHNNEIELDLTHALGTISGIEFYEDAWKASVGFGCGFLFDVTDTISAGVETGFNYSFGMSDDDTVLNGTGSFENTNDDGDRMSVPLMFSVRMKF